MLIQLLENTHAKLKAFRAKRKYQRKFKPHGIKADDCPKLNDSIEKLIGHNPKACPVEALTYLNTTENEAKRKHAAYFLFGSTLEHIEEQSIVSYCNQCKEGET
ncbi:iron-containing alcohol dehydrogenase [Bacillus megaterium]|nr:iron-containing alcohol dehydrogenase [Priestia megaterium]